MIKFRSLFYPLFALFISAFGPIGYAAELSQIEIDLDTKAGHSSSWYANVSGASRISFELQIYSVVKHDKWAPVVGVKIGSKTSQHFLHYQLSYNARTKTYSESVSRVVGTDREKTRLGRRKIGLEEKVPLEIDWSGSEVTFSVGGRIIHREERNMEVDRIGFSNSTSGALFHNVSVQ